MSPLTIRQKLTNRQRLLIGYRPPPMLSRGVAMTHWRNQPVTPTMVRPRSADVYTALHLANPPADLMRLPADDQTPPRDHAGDGFAAGSMTGTGTTTTEAETGTGIETRTETGTETEGGQLIMFSPPSTPDRPTVAGNVTPSRRRKLFVDSDDKRSYEIAAVLNTASTDEVIDSSTDSSAASSSPLGRVLAWELEDPFSDGFTTAEHISEKPAVAPMVVPSSSGRPDGTEDLILFTPLASRQADVRAPAAPSDRATCSHDRKFRPDGWVNSYTSMMTDMDASVDSSTVVAAAANVTNSMRPSAALYASDKYDGKSAEQNDALRNFMLFQASAKLQSSHLHSPVRLQSAPVFRFNNKFQTSSSQQDDNGGYGIAATTYAEPQQQQQQQQQQQEGNFDIAESASAFGVVAPLLTTSGEQQDSSAEYIFDDMDDVDTSAVTSNRRIILENLPTEIRPRQILRQVPIRAAERLLRVLVVDTIAVTGTMTVVLEFRSSLSAKACFVTMTGRSFGFIDEDGNLLRTQVSLPMSHSSPQSQHDRLLWTSGVTRTVEVGPVEQAGVWPIMALFHGSADERKSLRGRKGGSTGGSSGNRWANRWSDSGVNVRPLAIEASWRPDSLVVSLEFASLFDAERARQYLDMIQVRPKKDWAQTDDSTAPDQAVIVPSSAKTRWVTTPLIPNDAPGFVSASSPGFGEVYNSPYFTPMPPWVKEEEKKLMTAATAATASWMDKMRNKKNKGKEIEREPEMEFDRDEEQRRRRRQEQRQQRWDDEGDYARTSDAFWDFCPALGREILRTPHGSTLSEQQFNLKFESDLLDTQDPQHAGVLDDFYVEKGLLNIRKLLLAQYGRHPCPANLWGLLTSKAGETRLESPAVVDKKAWVRGWKRMIANNDSSSSGEFGINSKGYYNLTNKSSCCYGVCYCSDFSDEDEDEEDENEDDDGEEWKRWM